MTIIFGQTSVDFANKLAVTFPGVQHTHDYIVINGKHVTAGPRLDHLLPNVTIHANLITKEEWAKQAVQSPMRGLIDKKRMK